MNFWASNIHINMKSPSDDFSGMFCLLEELPKHRSHSPGSAWCNSILASEVQILLLQNFHKLDFLPCFRPAELLNALNRQSKPYHYCYSWATPSPQQTGLMIHCLLYRMNFLDWTESIYGLVDAKRIEGILYNDGCVFIFNTV